MGVQRHGKKNGALLLHFQVFWCEILPSVKRYLVFLSALLMSSLLNLQVTTLEILCRQHEETIQDKENVIRNQKSTLDKQVHIQNVIQGLFNGGGTPDLGALGLGK